jgi:hypothetical protein
MNKTVARILKSDDVKVEGRFQLNVAQARKTEGQCTMVDGQWRARIVENHVDFAVIEITCRCGARTYLRCEYASSKTIENVGATEQIKV